MELKEEIKHKAVLVGFWSTLVLLLALVLFIAIEKRNHDKDITDLQNKLAASSQTVETQKGVYERLALESTNLAKLLGTKDEQLKVLNDQVKKNKEDLLVVNSLVVTWKKQAEANLKGTQSIIPADPSVPGSVERKKVEFGKDFGFIAFKGYSLTDPPEAYVKIWQPRPLRFSIAISQLPDGSWRSRATSSEDNFAVDIALTGVNPHILEDKWYEKIGFSVDLGGATGFIAGLGVSYQIERFEFGPKVWVSFTGKVDTYVGANLTWHPFKR